MSTPLTLESVQTEFQHWRTHRAGLKSRIPASLKQKAVALSVNYPKTKIISALGYRFYHAKKLEQARWRL